MQSTNKLRSHLIDIGVSNEELDIYEEALRASSIPEDVLIKMSKDLLQYTVSLDVSGSQKRQWQSQIEQDLRGNVVMDIDSKMEYVEPVHQHPLYDSIKKAKVPKSTKGLAELLLHNLPQNVDQNQLKKLIKASSNVDVETMDEPVDSQILQVGLHTGAVEILQKVAEPDTRFRGLALLGVSGCGKTRSCYEALCCRMGFYFTAYKGGNGGSLDMTRMVIDAEFSCSKETIQTDIVTQAKRHLHALLLARAMVLEWLLRNWRGTLTPYEWLLIQIRPRLYLPIVNDEDYFEALYARLSQSTSDLIKTSLRECIKKIATTISDRLLVFVDEAQQLVHLLPNKFPSSSKDFDRSFLSMLCKCWCEQDVLLIASGTGLEISTILGEIASAMLKGSETFKEDSLITNFGGFNNMLEFQTFTAKFFPLGDEVIEMAFAKLRGRNRYTAYFIERVLVETHAYPNAELLVKNVIKEIENMCTKREHEGTSISPRAHIAKVVKHGTASEFEGHSPADILYQLAVSYYIFGNVKSFSSNWIFKMVEAGLTPLTPSRYGLRAAISEPLTALALKSYFEDLGRPLTHAVFELMGALPNPVAKGLFFEKLAIPKLISWLTKYPTIDQHPYFASLVSALPAWFRGCKLYPGNKKIIHASPTHGLDLASFLNKPSGDIFVAENSARYDATLFLLTAQNDVRLCSMQFKVHSSHLSVKELTEAYFTTSWAAPYTANETHQVLHHNKRSKLEVTSNVHQADVSGMLRIVFVHPPPSTEDQLAAWPATTSSNSVDVNIFVNRNSTRDVLTEYEWMSLHLPVIDDPF